MDRERGTSITERERAALDSARPSIERLWAQAGEGLDGSLAAADKRSRRFVRLMFEHGYLSRES